MSRNLERGRAGEDLAVNYLKSLGYKVLRRNFRYLKAEIDIIALNNGVLSFIEVKSRKGAFYGSISDNIPMKKRRLMVMAANHFVQEQNLDIEVQFDIITVIENEEGYTIDHLVDAFYPF